MAIVETGRAIDIFAKVAESARTTRREPRIRTPLIPIEQYTGEDAERLLQMYWNNRSFIDGVSSKDMDISQARVLGTLEIQGLILKMLGQEHFTWGERRPIDPRIWGVREITRKDIDVLKKRYEATYRLSVEGDFEDRMWINEDITPEEARVLANMYALQTILMRLGQKELVESIDQKTRLLKTA